MTKPTDSRVLGTLSLTGGLFTALGLSMAGHLMQIWAWVTSGGHPIGDPPGYGYFNLLDPEGHFGLAGAISGLLLGFAAGSAATYVVSRRPLRSFLENPSISMGWPGKWFVTGLLCSIASCILFVSLATLVGIVVDSFKHNVSISLLLLGPFAFSAMALYLLGLPIAFIGGIVGSITELVLRRIYRATAPPATSPDK